MLTPYIFFMIINVIAFIIVARDKMKARKKLWRTPEKVIFMLALVGGSLGVYLSMLFFRHKTKHKKFMIGIPLILILQLVIVCLILFKPELFSFFNMNMF